MTDNLSQKQKETLKLVRDQAEKILTLCSQAEHGEISGEEFEKRVSKSKVGIPGVTGF